MIRPYIDNQTVHFGRAFHALSTTKHTYANLALSSYVMGLYEDGMRLHFEALLANDELRKFLDRLSYEDNGALWVLDDELFGFWVMPTDD